MSLSDELTALLQQDPRLAADGQLLKNQITELALKLDKDLLRLLLSHDRLKAHFFVDVDGVLVFDRDKFVRFVNNKAFLPDSYTSFKNKIGLTTPDGRYLSESRDVVLAWPYKDCVLEGGQTQEDQRRDEIFWNELLAPDEIDRLLAPKVLTNWKRYDADGGHPVTAIGDTDNLILKGNNLLALHSLKKRFAGKVKMIYIDPPFNTGSDSFGYNNRFQHSTWLAFIKNRLEIARHLLSNDGTIYIHLDYNEVHYFKVLMDEVFGRQNFLNEVIWAFRERETSTRFYNRKHNTILFYAKDVKLMYTFNPDLIREEYSGVSRGKFKLVDEKSGRRYRLRTKDGRSDPAVEDETTYRQYLGEQGGPLPRDWFILPFINQASVERVGFSTQKPERLLQRFIMASTNTNDLVLDFFLGSGTTAAVAHKLGRRYIGIEQLDYIETVPVERLKRVIGGEQGGISKTVDWKGGGSLVYCELMQWNERFVQRIMAAPDKATLQAIWDEMRQKAHLSYRLDVTQFNAHAAEFADLSLEDQRRFLMEVLDKNQLYVNYSEMDDQTYGVSEKDKRLNRLFYGG